MVPEARGTGRIRRLTAWLRPSMKTTGGIRTREYHLPKVTVRFRPRGPIRKLIGVRRWRISLVSTWAKSAERGFAAPRASEAARRDLNPRPSASRRTRYREPFDAGPWRHPGWTSRRGEYRTEHDGALTTELRASRGRPAGLEPATPTLAGNRPMPAPRLHPERVGIRRCVDEPRVGLQEEGLPDDGALPA